MTLGIRRKIYWSLYCYCSFVEFNVFQSSGRNWTIDFLILDLIINFVSSQLSYSECLAKFGLDILFARRVALCSKLFNSITSSPGHRLFPLLLPSNPQRYNFWRSRAYATPRANTDIHLQAYIYQYRRLHLPVNAPAKNMFSTDLKRLCFRCQTLKFPCPNLSLRDLKRLCFRYQTLKFRHISVIFAGFSHIF